MQSGKCDRNKAKVNNREEYNRSDITNDIVVLPRQRIADNNKAKAA